MQSFSKKDIIRHSIAWIVIAICLFIADPILGGWKAWAIGIFLIMVNYIFVYYLLNLFIFQNFLEKKYLLLVVWIAIAYTIFETTIFFTTNFALPKLGGQNPHYPISLILINTLLLFFLLFVGALGNYINRVGTKKIINQTEREKAVIVKELNVLKKEKAIMAKELDFLKNQFNAHITFNFLNYCYSNVRKTSEKAAEAIETFVDMLRYSLQIKTDENVCLKNEIEYIENFISIQRCLTIKVCANLKYEGRIDEKMVLPRVLITFVENAFKHGEINNELHPIGVYLLATTNSVIFKVNNRKNLTKKIVSSDIGRQNVKQMLDAFYKDNYQLTIKDTYADYSVELILTI